MLDKSLVARVSRSRLSAALQRFVGPFGPSACFALQPLPTAGARIHGDFLSVAFAST